eukprot:4723881-Ditylum_brightwellii.AAC.1
MDIVEATSKRGPDNCLHIQDKDKEAKKAVTTKNDKRGENSKQDDEQSPVNRESNPKQSYLDSLLSGNPKNRHTTVTPITRDIQIRMNVIYHVKSAKSDQPSVYIKEACSDIIAQAIEN